MAAYLGMVFVLVTVNFVLPRAMPGDPIDGLLARGSAGFSLGEQSRAALEDYYGLDGSLASQYRHYLARLAHGDLAVDGDEIAFFNAAICGLTLPDGVGRYRWKVEDRKLHFQVIGKEPCGGRSDILDDSTYTKVG